MGFDRWHMVKCHDGNNSVEDAVSQKFQALVRRRRAMMRWMCNGFEEQGWKDEMVANDILERSIRWGKGDIQIVSTTDC